MAGRPTSRPVKYPEIINYLKKNGIKKSQIAKSLCMSPAYFSRYMYGDAKMYDTLLIKINTLLGTDFKHPIRTPDVLPHEELEATKQRLKDTPLFNE